MFNSKKLSQVVLLKNLFALIEKGNISKIQKIYNLSEYVCLKNGNGDTALHIAAQTNHEPIIHLLVGNGAFVNSENDNKETPVHLAAAYGSLNVLEVLLSQPNVDVNARDKAGNTPLHWAADLRDKEAFDLLIQYKADPNILNNANSIPTFPRSFSCY